jgi:glycerophosphoryl diester phosphodiesterase
MKTLLSIAMFSAVLASGAPKIQVHGHRGAASVRPENTMPSFEEAIRAGADYIELDVYATSDNHLVVIHDPAVNMAICQGGGGKRPIRSMTLAEVRQYDCGSLQQRAFPRVELAPGTRIPTLDEVFDLGKKHRNIRFNVEIKSSEKWKDYTPEPAEFCGMVAAAIRKHGLAKRVLVQSFDFRIVRAMKQAGPEFELAALYGPGERDFVDIAKETGVKMVNPNFKLVTEEKLKAAHAAGLRIIPWTIDTPDEWDRLLALGVDGLITNDPGALVSHLKAKGLR